MNTKTIIKWIVGAIAIYAAYSFFFGSKAEAQEVVTKTWQIDAEVGQYEKRIDSGLYTADDASYVKLGTDLGVFGGLSFVGDLEYVDTEDHQLYTTVGTVLSTPIGALGVSGQFTTIENRDNLFELGATYGVNILGVDSVVAVTVDDESRYLAEISTEYALYTNDVFVLSVGGAYGQSFETVDDYDYTVGYARIDAPLGVANVFVQFNYLNSDNSFAGTDGEWEATTDFGVSLSF
jgi:hypothetical protein|tara:strand:+ start:1899 stop:2603 length:705 start_codon:yes stop_codon:yes gene_type:complete